MPISVVFVLLSLSFPASAVSCLTASCSLLSDGLCGVQFDDTHFSLNEQGCPRGMICNVGSLLDAMTRGNNAVLEEFYCAIEISLKDSTPWVPVPCMAKRPNKGWKAGGSVLLCDQDSDCLKEDGTFDTGACVCVPRSDAKGVCKPDPSNDQVFGEYWTMCAANPMISNRDVYNYWNTAFSLQVYNFTNLPCFRITSELQQLENLRSAYLCKRLFRCLSISRMSVCDRDVF